MDCLFTTIYCKTHSLIVEPVYYGHLGTNQKCLDNQGVLISRSFYMIKFHLHNLGPQLSVDYAGVHNRFH